MFCTAQRARSRRELMFAPRKLMFPPGKLQFAPAKLQFAPGKLQFAPAKQLFSAEKQLFLGSNNGDGSFEAVFLFFLLFCIFFFSVLQSLPGRVDEKWVACGLVERVFAVHGDWTFFPPQKEAAGRRNHVRPFPIKRGRDPVEPVRPLHG
jgi:hypothetical protein